MRYFLAKRGFSAKAANEVIDNYRETIRYILENTSSVDQKVSTLVQSGSDSESAELFPDSLRQSRSVGPVVFSTFTDKTNGDTQDMDAEVLRYRISRDSHAAIRFTGPVTKGAVRKLIKLLELTVDDYPEDGGED